MFVNSHADWCHQPPMMGDTSSQSQAWRPRPTTWQSSKHLLKHLRDLRMLRMLRMLTIGFFVSNFAYYHMVHLTSEDTSGSTMQIVYPRGSPASWTIQHLWANTCCPKPIRVQKSSDGLGSKPWCFYSPVDFQSFHSYTLHRVIRKQTWYFLSDCDSPRLLIIAGEVSNWIYNWSAQLVESAGFSPVMVHST